VNALKLIFHPACRANVTSRTKQNSALVNCQITSQWR